MVSFGLTKSLYDYIFCIYYIFFNELELKKAHPILYREIVEQNDLAPYFDKVLQSLHEDGVNEEDEMFKDDDFKEGEFKDERL